MGGGIWAVVAGYIFTFWNSQVQEQRKARIDRVNLQLRDLYGPLLACVTATKSSYDAMVRQHSPDGTRDGFQAAIAAHPDGPEARAYRQWMTSVLQPLNERAAAVVQGGFSLMDGNALESEMLQLVAHVSASRVILERWAQGELGTASAISYPDKLEQDLRREFSRLKAIQAELLGVSPLRTKHNKHSSAAPQRELALKPKPPTSLLPSTTATTTHSSSAGSSSGVGTPQLQRAPTAGRSGGQGSSQGGSAQSSGGWLARIQRWHSGASSSSNSSSSGSNPEGGSRVSMKSHDRDGGSSKRSAAPHGAQSGPSQFCPDQMLRDVLAVGDLLECVEAGKGPSLAPLVAELQRAALVAQAMRLPIRSRL